MQSRFGPTGESRYTPRDRDRSPPRFERRGSNQHGSPILQRSNENSYRSGDSTAPSSNVRDGPREPPRGPRGASYSSRGRGYGPRDSRDTQFSRRESERDWQRRDTFDRRSPPPRNRSRTPPPNYHDTRDLDLNLSRVSRNVRDTGPLSATSTHSDPPSSAGVHHRGSSFRGRGRGEYDSRGRGRGGFGEDRDGFRQRSRSRDRITRDFRDDRSRDYERDSSRREDDKRQEWDRDGDRFRKEPPIRPDSRNSTGSHNNSASPLTASAPFKDTSRPSSLQDSSRRSSFVFTQTRPEFPRTTSTPQLPSSPMQAVQVSAFGTVNPSTVAPATKPFAAQTSPKEASPTPGRSDFSDPTRVAPKAPKADLNAQPPTGPKAPAIIQRRQHFPLNSPIRGYDMHHDTTAAQSPATLRFSGPSTPSSAPHSTGPQRIKAFASWGNPELGSRLSPSEVPTSMQRFQGHDSPSSSLTSINTSPRIPTGPKASQPSIRAPMNPRGSKPGAKTWVNPRLRGPSIMQPMTREVARREDESAARPSTSSSNREVARKPSRALSVGNGPPAGELVGFKSGLLEISQNLRDNQAPSEATSTRAVTPEDEDEDAIDDDEENMDLDQEDFDEQEKQFVKDSDALRSKKAPLPTENPTLLVLLEELDALASAADDLAAGVLPPPKIEEPSAASVPVAMPTPPNDLTGVKKTGDPIEFKLEEQREMADLPLEGLPFLPHGIPTPISEKDFIDIEDCEDELCQKIRESLAVESRADEDLRQEYARLYQDWREEVEGFDEEKRALEEVVEDKKVATPIPEVPAEPAPTPAVQIEPSGRRGLFASEDQISKLMDETKVENDMKTMQRVQDAQEKADPYKEAPIPDMLTLQEEKVYMFEDVNNQINSGVALQVFGFIPPSDDFNNEEQELFKEAYLATPKKWGHIAQYMKDAILEMQTERGEDDKYRPRNFHDCIRHYYLTKKECLYKNLQNKRGRKRGRAAMKGRGRGGATSIMGSSGTGEDMNNSPHKLTETGRPKRAAAPSFNDKEKKDGESLGRGSGASRRGGAASSSMLRTSGGPGEPAPEKTPARRGRQANKDKGAKRGAKPTVLAPNVSPIKKAVDTEVTMAESSMNEGLQARDLETAEVLARFSGASTSQQQPMTLFSQATQPDEWHGDAKPPLTGQGVQIPLVLPQAHSTSESVHAQRVLLAPGQQQPSKQSLQSQTQISPSSTSQVPPLPTAIAPQTPLQQSQQAPSASHVQPSLSQGAIPPPIATLSTKLPQVGRPTGTSSYWSVQEQQDFENLLRHYGRNWEAVAREMPAKTETMVKNFYIRQNQSGKKELEQLADEADRRNNGIPPSGPFLDPARQLNVGSSAGNAGRRRQTVSSASQRILAPNPDQVQQEGAVPAPSEPPQPSTASSQVSPQDRGHARLAIAPQRPPNAPSGPVVGPSSVAEQAAPVSRVQSQAQPPLRPAQKELLQTQAQAPQVQPAENQAQQPFRAAQVAPFASDLSRNGNATSAQSSTKRPRSQTEHELMEREQPSKRQGLEYEAFNSALSLQHEQQQQQQRPIARAEQPSQYDYKGPRQQHQQIPTASMPRTTSNPDDADRLARARPIQPSVSPREFRRNSFGGGPKYAQSNIQPSMQSHLHSTAQPPVPQSAMQAAMQVRPPGGSPAQRTPPELSRPSSVSVPAAVQPPSRPTSQVPAKRSNLMSLLNDEPSEPQPRRLSVEARPAPPPPPRHASPLTQTPMYQAPSQPAPYSRRDVMIDPIRDAHQGMGSRQSYVQQAYGSPANQPLGYREPSQQQQQSYSTQHHSHQQASVLQPQHQPAQAKENLNWSTSRSYYNDPVRPPVEPPRPLYHQQKPPPSAASPPPPQSSSQPSSSAAYIQPSRSSAYPVQHQAQPPPQLDGPSHTPHPPSHSAHSRASSFTGPGQALAPSPYAQIRPTSTPQISLQAHPPQPLSPQHPSYYSAALGPGRPSGMGFTHENLRGGHPSEPPRTGGPGSAREEPLGGPRRYTPTQTPPSGGGYGYPPPPPPQGGHGPPQHVQGSSQGQVKEEERGGWNMR